MTYDECRREMWRRRDELGWKANRRESDCWLSPDWSIMVSLWSHTVVVTLPDTTHCRKLSDLPFEKFKELIDGNV